PPEWPPRQRRTGRAARPAVGAERPARRGRHRRPVAAVTARIYARPPCHRGACLVEGRPRRLLAARVDDAKGRAAATFAEAATLAPPAPALADRRRAVQGSALRAARPPFAADRVVPADGGARLGPDLPRSRGRQPGLVGTAVAARGAADPD